MTWGERQDAKNRLMLFGGILSVLTIGFIGYSLYTANEQQTRKYPSLNCLLGSGYIEVPYYDVHDGQIFELTAGKKIKIEGNSLALMNQNSQISADFSTFRWIDNGRGLVIDDHNNLPEIRADGITISVTLQNTITGTNLLVQEKCP